ncbi:MAG: hypothetical protein HY902_06815 [Deltaproteobacteria bacterium]|nr:hypothetical protein [Deltaproteobacteria bacterium]
MAELQTVSRGVAPTGPSRWQGGLWLALAATPVLTVALLAVQGLASLDYHANLLLAPVTCAASLAFASRNLAVSGWLSGGLVLAAPLATLLALSPWQPNCDIPTGLAFWLLGPAAAALCGAALGALARWMAGPRPATRAILATALLLLSCAPAAWAFLSQPQVFGVAMPTGWVAGALYEDAVAPTWSYLAFRLLDLAWAGAVLALDRLMGRPMGAAALEKSWPHRDVRAPLRAGLAGTAAVVGLLRAEPEGWRLDRAAVEQQLPVLLEVREGNPPSALWRIHVARGERWRRASQLLQSDVQFRMVQLRRWFGVLPDTLDIYAWPDADSKRRGMGAHRVEMAKPWLRQIHLVLPEFGASVLTHELAHVAAGEWADNPLRVPLRHGWLPDALTIEGTAVAAEWPLRGGLDPHQWTRAARQLGKAPALADLRNPAGFLRQNNDLAYTVAGSLLRWVRDTHGAATLQAIYRDGDVERALGAPLDEIERRWLAAIEAPGQPPLSDVDLERARARFEPAGLFDRTCALCVGRFREQVDLARRAGQARRATALCSDLLARLAAAGAERDLGLELTVADAEAAAGQPERALERLQGLPVAGFSRLQRAEVLTIQGDLHWLRGAVAAARQAWAQVGQLPIGEGTRRVAEIKTELAGVPLAKAPAGALLAYGFPPARPEQAAAALVERAGDHPLVRYLALRQRLRLEQSEQAVADLAELLPSLAGRWPWTAREATRLLALHLARLGRCGALQGLDTQGEPALVRAEWRDRCAESARAALAAHPQQGQESSGEQPGPR